MEYHINLRELEERGKKAADYKWDHEQRACGLMAQLAIAERLESIAESLQNLAATYGTREKRHALEAYYQQRDEERQWQKMQKTHCCAICQAELVIPWSAEENRSVLRCGHDKLHRGYAKRTAAIINTLQSIAEASPEQREACEQAMEIYKNERGEECQSKD